MGHPRQITIERHIHFKKQQKNAKPSPYRHFEMKVTIGTVLLWQADGPYERIKYYLTMSDRAIFRATRALTTLPFRDEVNGMNLVRTVDIQLPGTVERRVEFINKLVYGIRYRFSRYIILVNHQPLAQFVASKNNPKRAVFGSLRLYQGLCGLLSNYATRDATKDVSFKEGIDSVTRRNETKQRYGLK